MIALPLALVVAAVPVSDSIRGSVASAPRISFQAPQLEPAPDSTPDSTADQDPTHGLPRGLVFGEVKDVEGQPWVGATVVLEACAIDEAPHLGDRDVVRVLTDERGRYRAKILRGWAYTAWAEQAVAGSGDLRVSNAETGVRVGEPTELTESSNRCGPAVVEIAGADPWGDAGPLQLEVVRTRPWSMQTLAFPENGELRVDPTAGGAAVVTVLAADGRRLGTVRAVSGSAGNPRRAELELLPPKRVFAKIYEENGFNKPIPNATLYQYEPWRSWPLATTGADGAVEFTMPNSGQDFDAWQVRVVASKFATGFVEKTEEEKDDERAKAVRKAGGVVVRGGLAKGTVATGRILGGGGQPLAGLPILLVSEAHGEISDSAYYGGDAKWSTATDAQGRFRGEMFWRSGQGQVHALLTFDALRSLPEMWRPGLDPRVFLGAVESGKEKVELGDRQLDRYLSPWDIVVQDPEGLPAAGATVRFLSGGDGDDDLPPLQADRLGRLRLLLPRTANLSVVISHANGGLVQSLQIEPLDSVDEVARVPVWMARMGPSLTIRGKAVDAAGTPIPDVQVRVGPMWNQEVEFHTAETEAFDMGWVRVTPQILPKSDGYSVLQSVLNHATVRTNKQGEFEIKVPKITGIVELNAWYSQDGNWHNAPEQTLNLIGEDEAIDLTLPVVIKAG